MVGGEPGPPVEPLAVLVAAAHLQVLAPAWWACAQAASEASTAVAAPRRRAAGSYTGQFLAAALGLDRVPA